MARIGHNSAAAALRYQHVIDGQDAAIVDFLERFGHDPAVTATDRQEPARLGTQWARTPDTSWQEGDDTHPEQDFCGGADGTRTHDPLLAKQVL